MNLLEVEGLGIDFGGLTALDDVSFSVEPGEIVSVIGPNGAGKSGVQPVTAGTIRFRGEDIGKVPAHKRLMRGLAQSPEGRRIFTNLTVEENLRLGAYLYADERVLTDMADALSGPAEELVEDEGVRAAYLGM